MSVPVVEHAIQSMCLQTTNVNVAYACVHATSEHKAVRRISPGTNS